jgi:hypothetical protein
MYCKVQEAGVRRDGFQALQESHSPRILRHLTLYPRLTDVRNGMMNEQMGEKYDHERT